MTAQSILVIEVRLHEHLLLLLLVLVHFLLVNCVLGTSLFLLDLGYRLINHGLCYLRLKLYTLGIKLVLECKYLLVLQCKPT